MGRRLERDAVQSVRYALICSKGGQKQRQGQVRVKCQRWQTGDQGERHAADHQRYGARSPDALRHHGQNDAKCDKHEDDLERGYFFFDLRYGRASSGPRQKTITRRGQPPLGPVLRLQTASVNAVR